MKILMGVKYRKLNPIIKVNFGPYMAHQMQPKAKATASQWLNILLLWVTVVFYFFFDILIESETIRNLSRDQAHMI